jgi:hypothetical protein
MAFLLLFIVKSKAYEVIIVLDEVVAFCVV